MIVVIFLPLLEASMGEMGRAGQGTASRPATTERERERERERSKEQVRE